MLSSVLHGGGTLVGTCQESVNHFDKAGPVVPSIKQTSPLSLFVMEGSTFLSVFSRPMIGQPPLHRLLTEESGKQTPPPIPVLNQT